MWLPGPTAHGELVVRVKDAAAIEGQSGSFDVVFEVPAGTFDLAAYMIELNLSGSGVRFTHFAAPRNPVFPGGIAKPVWGSPPLPGTTAAAYDYLVVGSAPIMDGTGLLRVGFETDPGSAGTYDVTANPALAHTNFTNGQGELLSEITSISFQPSRLTVIPPPPTLTWDGSSNEWGSAHWSPGSVSPAGGEAMAVYGGRVIVEHSHTEQFAASLLIDGGMVEVTAGGAMGTFFDTTVAEGALVVDGLLTAEQLVVGPEGMLAGSGTVEANVVTLSGLLSPGRDLGGFSGRGELSAKGIGVQGATVPEPHAWSLLVAACVAIGIVSLVRRQR